MLIPFPFHSPCPCFCLSSFTSSLIVVGFWYGVPDFSEVVLIVEHFACYRSNLLVYLMYALLTFCSVDIN